MKNKMMEAELREKVLAYQVLQTRLGNLIKQRDLLLLRIKEAEETIKSLGELKQKRKIVFSIGSGIYGFGEISEKNRVLVDVGANIILEKSFEEGIEIIEKRKVEFEQILLKVQKEMENISLSLQQLEPEISKMVK